MVLIIDTVAKTGHLLLQVFDSRKVLLLTLKDTDHGTCSLIPDQIYRIVWKTWSKQAAVYQIIAEVEPHSLGIPTFKFFKSYPLGSTDQDETNITV